MTTIPRRTFIWCRPFINFNDNFHAERLFGAARLLETREYMVPQTVKKTCRCYVNMINMDVLQRKKIGRGDVRTRCKKLEAKIMDLLNDFVVEKTVDLKALKRNYETPIENIKAVDDDMMGLLSDEHELANEIAHSLEENDEFYKILLRVEECLARNLFFDSQPAFTSSPGVPLSNSNVHNQKVLLPKIQLPNFDGNIVNWQTFWDQLESAVDTQTSLSPIDKFSYLKSLLISTASDCIPGLALTNDNYHEAVMLLKERFGNKQSLIEAYVESLINLPAVKSMNQIKELRRV